jgi:hypothetical protein
LTSLCLTVLAPLALADAPPAAPPDLTDLVGARGASGETQMQARGYQFIRASQVRDQAWTFWWSDVQRACVAVSTVDGRYASLARVPDANCQTAGARPAGADAASERLTLVCFGEGQHLAYESHSGVEWNKDKKHYETTQRVESEKKTFQTAVTVEIEGGSGRIHLEGALIPPLNSGGSDGWWPLRDLQVGPESITGAYRLNGLNSPSVRVDRRTGLLTIKGIETFTGRCDKADAGGRKF